MISGVCKNTSIKSSAGFVPKFPEKILAFNSKLTLQQAYDRILSVADTSKAEGCIQPPELASLLEQSAAKKFEIRAYDGFEPSGRMHIAQGLLKTINVNKMTSSGVRFIFLVADWFAHLNNKFGGDLKKIQKVGEYFIEVWKACGMDLSRVEFVWSSDEINKRPDEYWKMVMDMARKNSITRIKRCGQIMGRKTGQEQNEESFKILLNKIFDNRSEDSKLSKENFIQKYQSEISNESDSKQPVAQLLYPLMQCTDIFFLKANICQLGMDQLKVNVLAREYCDTLGKKDRRLRKPIILSHHMLMGLLENQLKMSKSNPDSALFMEDSTEDINRKVRQAFCRPGDVLQNPILDYLKHVVFPWHHSDNFNVINGLNNVHINDDNNGQSKSENKIINNVQNKSENNDIKSGQTKTEINDQNKSNNNGQTKSENIDIKNGEIAKWKFKIERTAENGGNKEYGSFEEIEEDFKAELLHPADLKKAFALEINLLLEPIRKHFSKGEPRDLLKQVRAFSKKK